MSGIGVVQSFSDKTKVPEVVCNSLFASLDLNRDDSLNQTEIEHLIEDNLGLDAERAEAALLLMDKDGSGGVDRAEFNAWLRSKDGLDVLVDNQKYDILCKAIELFSQFDTDGSKTLDKSELKALLVALGVDHEAAAVDTAFDGIDEDGNGLISFREFLKWLRWLPTATSPMITPPPSKHADGGSAFATTDAAHAHIEHG